MSRHGSTSWLCRGEGGRCFADAGHADMSTPPIQRRRTGQSGTQNTLQPPSPVGRHPRGITSNIRGREAVRCMALLGLFRRNSRGHLDRDSMRKPIQRRSHGVLERNPIREVFFARQQRANGGGKRYPRGHYQDARRPRKRRKGCRVEADAGWVDMSALHDVQEAQL